MIYDEISKELIEFISNPIQNMQYLEKKESKFKMMFNLSSKAIIGEYINKLYPKIFFERELFYFLKVSQNEIEKLKSIDYPINKINLDLINKTCSNYIEIISKNIYVKEKYEIESMSIKIEYILDRIKENHNLRIENIETEIIKHPVLVISYFLTEILYYLSADILELEYKNKYYILKVKDKNKLKLKSYWMSEILEYNTKMMDKKQLKSYSIDNNKISKTLSNKIISYVFDKFLYLQLKYLDKDILQSEKFIFLKQLVLFASIFEYFVLNGRKTIHIKEILKMKVFNKEIIDFLIKYLDKEEQFYFIRYKNNKFHRGTLEFKFGIRYYIKQMMQLKDIEWKNNSIDTMDLGGILGGAFEKQYIEIFKNQFRKI